MLFPLNIYMIVDIHKFKKFMNIFLILVTNINVRVPRKRFQFNVFCKLCDSFGHYCFSAVSYVYLLLELSITIMLSLTN